MQYAYTAQASFDATHKSWFPPRCEELHGHRFTLSATAMFEEMDNGVPRGVVGIEKALDLLALEFDHKRLDDMLPGEVDTLNRMAAYFWERLAAQFSTLYEVKVADGKAGCGAIRKI